jgi:hypothetical protein
MFLRIEAGYDDFPSHSGQRENQSLIPALALLDPQRGWEGSLAFQRIPTSFRQNDYLSYPLFILA